MGRLESNIAFITGAASGIGAATALRFVEEGAIVVGFDLSDDGNDDWQKAAELQPRCRLIAGSVSDEGEVAAAVGVAKVEFGRIDSLVNCAGFSIVGRVHETPMEDWDSQVDVNLKGTFLVSRHVLPIMMTQESGSIVNISSVAGMVGLDLVPAYNAAKGAVILLARNISVDYGKYNIRANSICPGWIETPGVDEFQTEMKEKFTNIHQLKRWGEPVEVANACLFLCSDEASFISGVALPVDGGWTGGTRFDIAEFLGVED